MEAINLDEMKNKFEKALAYSQAYPFDLDSTKLIKKWYEEKKFFIKKFGGTIWRSSKPIELSLSEQQKRRKFNEFIDTMDRAHLLDYKKNDLTFESFLKDNYEGFYNNRVVKDYPEFNLKRGTKLLKSFKIFCPTSYTKFAQDVASQYLQKNKIEGYLYLSVDPLDFLTLSENNSNWDSCHTLYGTYRGGNLSYMVDSTTIVAYIANEKQEQLKCMPKGLLWNNKKWRRLVHINGKKSIIYNKPYPFEHNGILEEVDNSIKNLLFKNICFTKPMKIGFKYVSMGHDKISELEFNQLSFGGRVYDSREIFDCSEYLGFLDLSSSPSYVPIASINKSLYSNYKIKGIDFTNTGFFEKNERKEFKNIIGIKIGKKYPCPCCGKGYSQRYNSFLCESCIEKKDAEIDFFFKCYDCGRRIYDDEELYTINHAIYCKKCYKLIK